MVTELKDGEEMLSHIRSNPQAAQLYDACILDEIMPKMNGSDALRHLRQAR